MPGDADRPELRTVTDGRYRDLEYLGGGGMGTVYLATDTEMNRRVALKIARPGRTEPQTDDPLALPPPPDSKASRTLAARFIQEAWVTGNLEHPGIAPVYEVGLTPGGATYYTMRLIRGDRTLDDAIRSARTVESRIPLLDTFLRVCDTIAFAHSKGVIHRDLKPANIALGEYGEVVVIDWGIARTRGQESDEIWQEKIREIRDAGGFHTADSALGTPGYMPPEAVLGKAYRVDERSDVFALGAILFRLLTGRLPYRSGSYEEYVKQILTEPISTPRGVEPDVPDALSRVAARALAKNPAHRYPGAAELAVAIRAWQTETAREREVDALLAESGAALESAGGLEGDALLAQVDRVTSLTARLLHLSPGHGDAIEIQEAGGEIRARGLAERERAGRRRLLARGATAVLLLGAVAAVLVAGSLDRARRAAEAERANAVAARDRAEDERARAEDLAEFMLFDLRRGLRRLGRLDLLAGVAVRTKEYYDSIPVETLDEDASRRKAVALGRVGEILSRTGDLPGAEQAYGEAVAALAALSAAMPESLRRREDLAIARVKLGEIFVRRGETDAALASFTSSREILDRLVEEEPGEVSFRKNRAYCLNRIGNVLKDRGRRDEALALYDEALRVRRELVAARPGEVPLLNDLMSSLERAARHRGGKEAEALLAESFGIHRRLLDLEPDDADRHVARSAALGDLGDLLLDSEGAEAALEHYTEALEIDRKLVRQDPENTSWTRRLAISESRVSAARRLLGDPDAALDHAREALRLREGLAERDPSNARWQGDLAASRYRIGRLLTNTGDEAAALESHRAALSIRKRLVALDPRNVRWLLEYRDSAVRTADLMAGAGEAGKATVLLEEAIAALEAPEDEGLDKDAGWLRSRRDAILERAKDR